MNNFEPNTLEFLNQLSYQPYGDIYDLQHYLNRPPVRDYPPGMPDWDFGPPVAHPPTQYQPPAAPYIPNALYNPDFDWQDTTYGTEERSSGLPADVAQRLAEAQQRAIDWQSGLAGRLAAATPSTFTGVSYAGPGPASALPQSAAPTGQQPPPSLAPILARQYAQPQPQQRAPINYAPRAQIGYGSGTNGYASYRPSVPKVYHGQIGLGDWGLTPYQKFINASENKPAMWNAATQTGQTFDIPWGATIGGVKVTPDNVVYNLDPKLGRTAALRGGIPLFYGHAWDQWVASQSAGTPTVGRAGPSSALGSPSSVFGPSFAPSQYAPPSFQSPQLDLSWLYQLLGNQQGGFPV